MKTNELISALVLDGASASLPAWRRPLPAVLGLLGSFAIFAIWFGVRPDFIAAMQTPRFLGKLAIIAVLGLAAYTTVGRLARPLGSAPRHAAALLMAPLLLLALAVIIELLSTPAADWLTLALGSNALRCVTLIPLLSMAPLAGVVWVLRRGAPERPGLAGAAAGLVAASAGAFLYGTMCIDDSPLFVATWYPLGIVGVVTLGGLAGTRLLRW